MMRLSVLSICAYIHSWLSEKIATVPITIYTILMYWYDKFNQGYFISIFRYGLFSLGLELEFSRAYHSALLIFTIVTQMNYYSW